MQRLSKFKFIFKQVIVAHFILRL